MARPTDLLREYGSAVRGYWGELDGRGVKACLDDLADLIEETGNADLHDGASSEERSYLELCQHGRGHWASFCDAYGCEEADHD